MFHNVCFCSSSKLNHQYSNKQIHMRLDSSRNKIKNARFFPTNSHIDYIDPFAGIAVRILTTSSMYRKIVDFEPQKRYPNHKAIITSIKAKSRSCWPIKCATCNDSAVYQYNKFTYMCESCAEITLSYHSNIKINTLSNKPIFYVGFGIFYVNFDNMIQAYVWDDNIDKLLANDITIINKFETCYLASTFGNPYKYCEKCAADLHKCRRMRAHKYWLVNKLTNNRDITNFIYQIIFCANN